MEAVCIQKEKIYLGMDERRNGQAMVTTFQVITQQKNWANLFDSYTKIADRAKRTGEEKTTWPYFVEIDEMVGINENI